MLNGVNRLSLDDKGRLALPSKYRAALQAQCQSNLVITLDHERRVLIYPQDEWQLVEQKLQQLSSFKKVEAKIKRLYLGHAHDCQMDKNGRITIPPYLREKAALSGQVMLVGVGNKFELWNHDKWVVEMEQDDDELMMTQELEALSL